MQYSHSAWFLDGRTSILVTIIIVTSVILWEAYEFSFEKLISIASYLSLHVAVIDKAIAHTIYSSNFRGLKFL